MTPSITSRATPCAAHVLRELVAVTETGTDLDRAWAQQAIDALLALDEDAGAARAAGKNAIDPEALKEHEDWYRRALAAGIVLNAGRHGKLQENGTPSLPRCRPARRITCGLPATCASRSRTTRRNRSSG